MTRTALTAAMILATAGMARSQTISIPPETLPDESYFTANPGVTVNVESGGTIFPDAGDGTFTFNGATVNVMTGGGSGFFTVDHFVEDVTYNIDGGDLIRVKFVGGTGATELNINSGSVERGLWLQGNTACTIDGGAIGSVAGGQAAMIVEDDATCEMNAGDIDTFVVIQDNATFDQTGGTIAGAIQINDDAIVTISGGSSGDDGLMSDIGCVLNITGGTVGDDFVIAKGVANMSAGGMGTNSAILNTSGVDPVFNMTGGALGSDFRAYDGTFNLSGGLVGSGFRLGTPTGDGSGVTMNIVAKSATLDGAPLTLTTTPATVTARGGETLTCVLLDDSVVSFELNESFVSGEDRFRAGAVLTIGTNCVADTNGDGMLSPADFSAWVAAFNAMSAGCDQNGDGVCSPADFSAWVANYNAGC
ncbi:MAG: hypothetical protein KDA31_11775 [Phycisphaerales bacterium]|nr:hypothetical protein [Phycisphaerales bacterium]MCB9835791.1 hypothetical protein [Phycisphaera sp.]